jgi:hypothetical protein
LWWLQPASIAMASTGTAAAYTLGNRENLAVI